MHSSISFYLNQIKTTLIPDTKDMPNRRYDLDWLRVIVFSLLILFHTGMFLRCQLGMACQKCLSVTMVRKYYAGY